MTDREKLLANIENLIERELLCWDQDSKLTTFASIIRCQIANLQFFSAPPESAPAAGESGEEKPALIECDRCDGTGFYEGGKTMLTRCEVCNGTGAVRAVTP
jgi:hypothetical protein